MKKTMSTLLVVAGTFAVSGAFAAVDKPNPNPNDCEQYGVSAHVEERYDDFSGYRSTATVTRPASYDGEVKATVTRERRDGSTYTQTMDSEDYDYGILSVNRDMETRTHNYDKAKSVDIQCYPNSK